MCLYEAVIFDLDDTLVDWNKAADLMFQIVLEKCYGVDVEPNTASKMLSDFKKLGNNGYSDKRVVFNTFYKKYPPVYGIPEAEIYTFWDANFPTCFYPCDETIDILGTIKQFAKLGMITNGRTETQKNKMKSAQLYNLFDSIVVSEEAGISKPDKRIFELTLESLNVSSDKAIFIGDNIVKDIGGAQNAKIKGIWFNPKGTENKTDIIPFAEIVNLKEVLEHLAI